MDKPKPAPAYYPAIYTDDWGIDAITLANDFHTLSTCIRGERVMGNEFADLVAKLTVQPTHYQFSCAIPQILLNQQHHEQPIILHLTAAYHVSTGESISLSVLINQQSFHAHGQDIEQAFQQLIAQFPQPYYFKNCYGCQFSDYSVYGSSTFGSLWCFIATPTAYQQTQDKLSYMCLTPTARVQEIFCCPHYCIRTIGSGYRG